MNVVTVFTTPLAPRTESKERHTRLSVYQETDSIIYENDWILKTAGLLGLLFFSNQWLDLIFDQ